MVSRGVEVLDAALHVALRDVVVGDGGGFGPLQDELAALPLGMGGLGIYRGQDVRLYAFLARALQFRGLKDEILGEWEVPSHPEVQAAREMFSALAGVFDGAVLEDPEYVQGGCRERWGLSWLRRGGITFWPLQRLLVYRR
jgi:hypothetical protein